MIERDRVAEVIVEAKEGVGRRGSGYRVTTNTVLTAAHVVADATRVRVRFNADRPTEWSTAARVELTHEGGDVAALSMTSSRPACAVTPVLYGKVGQQAAVAPCIAVGFPRFKLRNDPPSHLPARSTPSQYRDSYQVEGTISALSNWREGTLEVLVPPPERDPDSEHSPWEGLSGAAVWGSGRIVGVISEHHRSDGLNRLAAVRTDRWYELLPPDSLTRLGTLTGLPPTAEELVDVLPPESLRFGAAESWRADPELARQITAEIRVAEAHPSRLAHQLRMARSAALEINPLDKAFQHANVERLLFTLEALEAIISATVRIRDADIESASADLREVLRDTRGVGERPARRRLQACCHLGLYATALGKLDQTLSGVELLQVFACDPELGRELFPRFAAAMSKDLTAAYDRQLREIEEKQHSVVEAATSLARSEIVRKIGKKYIWHVFSPMLPLPPGLLTGAAQRALHRGPGPLLTEIEDTLATLKETFHAEAKRDFDSQVRKRMRDIAERALRTE